MQVVAIVTWSDTLVPGSGSGFGAMVLTCLVPASFVRMSFWRVLSTVMFPC